MIGKVNKCFRSNVLLYLLSSKRIFAKTSLTSSTGFTACLLKASTFLLSAAKFNILVRDTVFKNLELSALHSLSNLVRRSF